MSFPERQHYASMSHRPHLYLLYAPSFFPLSTTLALNESSLLIAVKHLFTLFLRSILPHRNVYGRTENKRRPQNRENTGCRAEDELVEAQGEEHLYVNHVRCTGGLFVRETRCKKELLW